MTSKTLKHFLLLATFSTSAFAADVEYSGRINMTEYFSKEVRKSWCIFSDGNSRVDSKEISQTAHGQSQELFDTYTFRGVNYLRRKVEWESQSNERSFTINFLAADANFSASQKYDKSTCTYKTWMGQSTSAETKLTARSAFLIPKNVWAIRIIHHQDTSGGEVAINLSNLDYAQQKDGKIALVPTQLSSFNRSSTDQYFLVNPSTGSEENFVYLDMVYQSRTLNANSLNLKFTIEFIAAEQCLKELGKEHFSNLINRKITQNLYDDAFINMACMLTPTYVQHTLQQLHLNGAGDFFKDIKKLETSLIEGNLSEQRARDRDTIRLFFNLTDKVKFYYSFEILKEAMNMLTQKVHYHEQSVDAWMYLEILRRRSMLYLVDILVSLDKNLARLPRNSALIKLSTDENVKFDIFLNDILPIEFRGFERTTTLIYRPQYLGADHFENLQHSVDQLLKKSKSFLHNTQLLTDQSPLTISQVDQTRFEIKELIKAIHTYTQQIEKFRITSTSSNGFDWINSRRELINEFEKLFQLNIVALKDEVGEYYLRHFEDPTLRSIEVNGKKYSDVRDFIQNFEQILLEVRQ